MTEPEIPINKRKEKNFKKSQDVLPSPNKLPQFQNHQPPPKLGGPVTRSSCTICGKLFSTKEELTLHTETYHSNPKKRV